MAKFDPRTDYAGRSLTPGRAGGYVRDDRPAPGTGALLGAVGYVRDPAPRSAAAPLAALGGLSYQRAGMPRRAAPLLAVPVRGMLPDAPRAVLGAGGAIMPVASGKLRVDPQGDGWFGSGRGHRLHAGIDLLAVPGEDVRAPWGGEVTKNGWVYTGDSRYRYVEVWTDDGRNVRSLYTAPGLAEGTQIKAGDVIGTAQDVSLKWGGGMLPHIELQVRLNGKPRTRLGDLVDPWPLLGGVAGSDLIQLASQ